MGGTRTRTADSARRTAVVVVAAILLVAVGTGVATASHGGVSDGGNDDGACSWPVTVTDGTGETVTERPARLVALQPSAARTLWTIGASDRVVGLPVNDYTADLNGTAERTNVVQADDYHTDIETVIALEPDLVLAPDIVDNGTIGTLREANLTVVKLDRKRSLSGIAAQTERIGRLVGACAAADREAERVRQHADRVREAVRGQPQPRVLFVTGGGFAAGNGTMVDNLIEIAGGRNVASEAGIDGYARISDEVVVTENPEWLVASGNATATIPDRAAYANTTAVRQNQTLVLDANRLSQPTPQLLGPLTRLARALHPSVTIPSPARAVTTPGRTTTRTTATPEDTTGEPATTAGERTPPQRATTSEGAPLSPALVVVALVAAALLGRRQRDG
jgi:iron complex transport system substrate-binding protein